MDIGPGYEDIRNFSIHLLISCDSQGECLGWTNELRFLNPRLRVTQPLYTDGPRRFRWVDGGSWDRFSLG